MENFEIHDYALVKNNNIIATSTKLEILDILYHDKMSELYKYHNEHVCENSDILQIIDLNKNAIVKQIIIN